MKNLNCYLGCLTMLSFCAGSVCAQPALVSPRVPPATAAPAARGESTPMFHPKPPGPPGSKIVTTTADGVPGSLRAVLAGASAGDTIRFALHFPATVVLSNTLVITQSVNIVGPGPDALTVMRTAASNAPLFRVFDVESGAVSMAGFTIANGVAFDATSYFDNVGGGIFNRGTLNVSNCVLTGNSAPTTSVTNIGFGGGIFCDVGSTLNLVNTTLSGNTASAAGGGLSTIQATLFAKGCTFSDNFAALQGGGINFQGGFGTLQNCTISSNAVSNAGYGSGLLTVAIAFQAAPSLTVTACTIAGNTGTPYGAVDLIAENDDLGLTNRFLSTIVADNDAPNFYAYGPVTFISLGHNLDSDGTSGLVDGVNGDQVGTSGSPIDPKLGPLQDNGGPTFTMALLVGSPAIGAGSCVDANGAPLHVDQRGFPRPASTGCDIGAYENEPLTLICPSPIVVDFQTAAGAVVCFRPKVFDFCPSVTVVSTPPSGSLFPIGDTVVTVQATDGCSSNSASCSFTVTVLSPQGVKSNVLAQLEILRAWARNPADKKKLDRAITDVSDSLGLDNPSQPLWLDPTHLDPNNGSLVFLNEQDAVAALKGAGNSHGSGIPERTLDEISERLVKCDRLLAEVSIQDAMAAHGDPSKIAKAKQEVARGDKDASHGNDPQAIQHYWNAWALTVNL